MARAQEMSNQRAIRAKTTVNEFLANPLVGTAMPGSAQLNKIIELNKTIDCERMQKDVLLDQFTQKE